MKCTSTQQEQAAKILALEQKVTAATIRAQMHWTKATEAANQIVTICQAFLSKYPTLFGYTIVAPKAHREQVTGDFSEIEYLDLQRFVYRVSEAVRVVAAPERMYVLSLGSQAANAHVHWHIAPLPEGVPLAQQQYYALMHEHGVLDVSPVDTAAFASRVAAELQRGQ